MRPNMTGCPACRKQRTVLFPNFVNWRSGINGYHPCTSRATGRHSVRRGMLGFPAREPSFQYFTVGHSPTKHTDGALSPDNGTSLWAGPYLYAAGHDGPDNWPQAFERLQSIPTGPFHQIEALVCGRGVPLCGRA